MATVQAFMVPSSACNTHQLFLDRLPNVLRLARYCFRDLTPLERDEAVAEAQAAAFQSYYRLNQQGRANVVFTPGFARHAIHHVLDGRRVGGAASSTDVHSR